MRKYTCLKRQLCGTRVFIRSAAPGTIEGMASSVYAVMVFDGERLLDARYGVTPDRVIKVAEEFQQKHGASARVLVDGRELGDISPELSQTRTPAQIRQTAQAEHYGVELAHHLLWESYKRASNVQAHMVQQMSATAVDMNRRFVEQLEEMRGKYQGALEKIDAMSFQQKMVEQESAFRQLSNHHQRMAADERIAEERRRTANQSVIEQIGSVVGAVARVISTIGGDSIEGGGTTRN
jgi:hypothetical protein